MEFLKKLFGGKKKAAAAPAAPAQPAPQATPENKTV